MTTSQSPMQKIWRYLDFSLHLTLQYSAGTPILLILSENHHLHQTLHAISLVSGNKQSLFQFTFQKAARIFLIRRKSDIFTSQLKKTKLFKMTPYAISVSPYCDTFLIDFIASCLSAIFWGAILDVALVGNHEIRYIVDI